MGGGRGVGGSGGVGVGGCVRETENWNWKTCFLKMIV